jgi:hypothetical protein
MSDKHANSRRHPSRREVLLAGGSLLAVTALGSLTGAGAKAQTAGKKPNILVIFGDDIGWWNTSAYNRGQMGYQTPNIDRIADEGAIFTDLYAQQSCTAGPRRVHYRAKLLPHRAPQSWSSRRQGRPVGQGSNAS